MRVYRISKEKFESTDWTEYDRATGQAHLANYDCVYLDEYCSPIDNEYLLEEIEKGNVEIKEG